MEIFNYFSFDLNQTILNLNSSNKPVHVDSDNTSLNNQLILISSIQDNLIRELAISMNTGNSVNKYELLQFITQNSRMNVNRLTTLYSHSEIINFIRGSNPHYLEISPQLANEIFSRLPSNIPSS